MTIEKIRSRVFEIDFLRGILIIGMCIDHFMFDLGVLVPGLLGTPECIKPFVDWCTWYYKESDFRLVFRNIGLLLFFFLVGVSSKFSKNNLKRGLITLGFGIGISIIMLIWSTIEGYNRNALFTILSCLGTCMILYWAFRTLFIKVFKIQEKNWKWWALGFGCAFLVGSTIMKICLLDRPLTIGNFFYTMMGVYTPGYDKVDLALPLAPNMYIPTIIGAYQWGSDWLGLLPFVSFTFLGGFVGELVYVNKNTVFCRRDPEKNKAINIKLNEIFKPINFCGRHTIWIYLGHQAVLIPLAMIPFAIGRCF